MTQYYGIDWIMLVLVLVNVWLLGNKQRIGFLVGAASCVLGILFSILICSIPNGIASAILLFLNLRGYGKWKP